MPNWSYVIDEVFGPVVADSFLQFERPLMRKHSNVLEILGYRWQGDRPTPRQSAACYNGGTTKKTSCVRKEVKIYFIITNVEIFFYENVLLQVYFPNC